MPTVLLHDVDPATLTQLVAELPAEVQLIEAVVDTTPAGNDASARLLVVGEGGREKALERIGGWADDAPDVPIVVLAPLGRMDLAVRAMRAGAFDVLPDPVDARLLGLTLQRALEHASLRRQLRELRSSDPRRSGTLLGDSPAMRRLDRVLDRMAPTPSSVLITGASGTGKELVARALHDRSPRASGPFVAINCAAVPDALLESELFGHVKGAFTDARTARSGLFVQATGGTLFLDEIGDLPATLQPKLLRVLQERTVRPVGGDREIPLDVRIIAATHQDLDALVDAGRFRADLLYRLDVLRLELPPLCERGQDVLLLAQRFLADHAERMGRDTPSLPSEVARVLLDHTWPGNVRELQNAMERAAALAGEAVTLADLPPRLLRAAAAIPAPSTPADPSSAESAAPSGAPLPSPARGTDLRPLEVIEREHILSVLDAVDGQKARAASILGLDRKTLYRKLRAWDLDLED